MAKCPKCDCIISTVTEIDLTFGIPKRAQGTAYACPICEAIIGFADNTEPRTKSEEREAPSADYRSVSDANYH